MKVRFYTDPETGEPHLLRHGVSEQDAVEVLEQPLDDQPALDGARAALGCTRGGRTVRIIYVPDNDKDSVFVITGYPLRPKALRALRRKLERLK